ncbi:MAG TPA: hypothetical protein VFD58_17025 [Blastocatellia bacterium]|nr:hypothetical protein [Blastocatellia bacterium]
MKDNHIIHLLEEAPFDSLSEGNHATIRGHIIGCAECRRAYEAARISAALVKERAARAVEPSPFFQTRVMAALRAQRQMPEPSALARLWKSAGLLFSAMVTIVALLSGLTLFSAGPEPQPDASGPGIVVVSPVSAERVVFAEPADDEMTNGQAFTAIYQVEDNSGSGYDRHQNGQRQ